MGRRDCGQKAACRSVTSWLRSSEQVLAVTAGMEEKAVCGEEVRGLKRKLWQVFRRMRRPEVERETARCLCCEEAREPILIYIKKIIKITEIWRVGVNCSRHPDNKLSRGMCLG